MKMEDITKLNEKEIVAKVGELRRELFNLKMQKGVSGLEKPHRVKEVKRTVARLLTAANAKGSK